MNLTVLVRETIDEEDENLKHLKNKIGDEVYRTVTAAQAEETIVQL